MQNANIFYNHIQERQELYQLVAPLGGLGIWERNLTTNATYCNSIVREILEVNAEYPVEPETALLFCKNPESIRALLAKVIDTGHPQQAELNLVTINGTLKRVRMRMNIRSEKNSARLIYGTLEDITDEVNLRNFAKGREKQFTSAFENAPIGMALVSLTGCWLQVNKSLCDLLGFQELELYKRTFQEITFPEDLSSDLTQMQQLLDGKIERYSMEKRYVHKDGHIIWALLNVSLVRDNEHIPLYFISQIKDITERRKSSEIIKAQNARLLNFAHIVSHNLRSHAGNIRMLSEMALVEGNDNEKNFLLSMLTESADNMLETLSQLNEIVKIHDKGSNDHKQLFLDSEVQRVIKILSASIIREQVEVYTDIPKNLMVLFNPSYLESIFVNLLTNSIRYKHPDRPAKVQITAHQEASSVIVKFADNGIGIDMDLHGHKLFGMYKTFHGNEDARGLGLFLVKNQVEAMEGTIIATSAIDKGTTFTIEIKNKIL